MVGRPGILWRNGIMSSSNVDRLVEKNRAVYEAAESVVSGMQDKERKQIKDLATAVGSLVGKEPKEVLALVSMFAHDCDSGYVTRGKRGGFVKGVKVVKPAKPVKADDSVSTDDVSST